MAVQICVEDYILNLGAKCCRLKLENKKPSKCKWFNNKVPSYTHTDKENSLNVFDNDNYNKYIFDKDDIVDHNALVIDTHDIYQLDFDNNCPETIDALIKLGVPYYLSLNKRLHHFIFRDKNLKDNRNCIKFTTKHSKGKHVGELLKGQWSFCRADEKIENADISIDNADFIDFDIMNSDLILINTQTTNDKPPISKPSTTTTTTDELEEYAECIDVEKRINRRGCYEDWRNIVWSLASVGEYEIAKKLSMRGEDTWNEIEFNKVYNSYNRKTLGVTLGTFFYYCKCDNQELYYNILNKNKKKVSVISAQTHYDKAKLIIDNLGEYFINSCGVLYVWVEEQRKWIADNKLHHTRRIISNQLTEWGQADLLTLPRYIVSENGLQTDNPDWLKLKTIINQNKMIPEVKNITEAFVGLIAAKFDNIEFDANPYILAFNNCVIDVKNMAFRPLQKEDYITMGCGYNWVQPTQQQYDLIDTIFKEIFVNEEIRKCYLSVLYNGLIGICPETFVVANGSGRNGKGLINELMRSALGDYGYELISTALCDKLKDGANPSIANMHKKRFVTCAEPDSTHPLNTDTIKKLTGGGEINARTLYSDNTKTILMCVLVLEANDKPTLGGNEADSDALKCRMMDILFNSKFVDKDEDVDTANNKFKRNEYFKEHEFKIEHRCALIQYILRNGSPAIYKPDCVMERSKQYLLGNDKIYECVSTMTTPATGQFVKVKDLYTAFKETDEYSNMNKADKRKYNYRYFTEKVKTHSQFKQYYKDKIDFTIDGVRTQAHNVLWGLDWLDDVENEDDIH